MSEAKDKRRWRGIRKVYEAWPRRRLPLVWREKLRGSKRAGREWMRKYWPA